MTVTLTARLKAELQTPDHCAHSLAFNVSRPLVERRRRLLRAELSKIEATRVRPPFGDAIQPFTPTTRPHQIP
jgi:hypothetical protein